MSLKDALRQKTKEIGFDLMGVTGAQQLEAVDYPPDRGLMRPSEIMHDAKIIIVMGMVIWDEAMNTTILAHSGENGYFNFYREITEMLAWRVADWLNKTENVKTIPSHNLHLKVAAQLAGLGFIGRSTLVITPQFGPRVRWVALLSTAELEPDQPFTRDLCAEQPLCNKVPLCIKACPCGAIKLRPSSGAPSRETVIPERCCITHTADQIPNPKWEKHINRVSKLGVIECTKCNLICPYGKYVDEVIIPGKLEYPSS